MSIGSFEINILSTNNSQFIRISISLFEINILSTNNYQFI